MIEYKKRDWETECNRYHGKVLTGKRKHYCYEWDGMPIDETCEEFKVCCCFPNSEQNPERSVATDDEKNYQGW